VSEARLQKPGRKNAPRERDGLFDIVKRNTANGSEIVARIERSEIRGKWLPHFAALNAGYEAAPRPEHGSWRDALLPRMKNQPLRVVGSAPLFPACYLQ